MGKSGERLRGMKQDDNIRIGLQGQNRIEQNKYDILERRKRLTWLKGEKSGERLRGMKQAEYTRRGL